MDKNDIAIGSQETSRGEETSRAKVEERLSTDLADRFCLNSYYSFYPFSASSSSRSSPGSFFLSKRNLLSRRLVRNSFVAYMHHELREMECQGRKSSIQKGKKTTLVNLLSLIVNLFEDM